MFFQESIIIKFKYNFVDVRTRSKNNGKYIRFFNCLFLGSVEDIKLSNNNNNKLELFN